MSFQIRRFGGPTAVFTVGGRTFMTDPTFDPPGEYPLGTRVLTKTAAASGTPADAGAVRAGLAALVLPAGEPGAVNGLSAAVALTRP